MKMRMKMKHRSYRYDKSRPGPRYRHTDDKHEK